MLVTEYCKGGRRSPASQSPTHPQAWPCPVYQWPPVTPLLSSGAASHSPLSPSLCPSLLLQKPLCH